MFTFCKPVDLLNPSESLEKVKHHKDLGVFITSDLKWPSQVQIRLKEARKAFFLLGIGSFLILPPPKKK